MYIYTVSGLRRAGLMILYVLTAHTFPRIDPRALCRVALDPPRRTIFAAGCVIAAGFPSPAEDYIEGRIDLNEHLIQNRESTFILRVKGWSMVDAGIHDGDELIVDRSLQASHGKVIVAVINGELTVKRLHQRAGMVQLLAANTEYAPIDIRDGDEVNVWGVVTRVLHKV